MTSTCAVFPGCRPQSKAPWVRKPGARSRASERACTSDCNCPSTYPVVRNSAGMDGVAVVLHNKLSTSRRLAPQVLRVLRKNRYPSDGRAEQP